MADMVDKWLSRECVTYQVSLADMEDKGLSRECVAKWSIGIM